MGHVDPQRNIHMYHYRPMVSDIRDLEKCGEKISMLCVTTPHEATAAVTASILKLSIEGRYFDVELHDAVSDCFVQVGLPNGCKGRFEGRPLATA